MKAPSINRTTAGCTSAKAHATSCKRLQNFIPRKQAQSPQAPAAMAAPRGSDTPSERCRVQPLRPDCLSQPHPARQLLTSSEMLIKLPISADSLQRVSQAGSSDCSCRWQVHWRWLQLWFEIRPGCQQGAERSAPVSPGAAGRPTERGVTSRTAGSWLLQHTLSSPQALCCPPAAPQHSPPTCASDASEARSVAASRPSSLQ